MRRNRKRKNKDSGNNNNNDDDGSSSISSSIRTLIVRKVARSNRDDNGTARLRKRLRQWNETKAKLAEYRYAVGVSFFCGYLLILWPLGRVVCRPCLSDHSKRVS